MTERFQVVRKGVVGSTLDEALALYAAGVFHGVAVVAEEQTAGRGRRGRTWHSPPGHLYLSALVRLAVPPAAAPGLTLDVGLAVLEALEAPEARLKWPNDVLARGRKLAGVLVTVAGTHERTTDLVIGIGVDVAPLDDTARALSAISLVELVDDPSLSTVEGRVLDRLAFRCAAYEERGGVDREAWLRNSTALGARVRVSEPGRQPESGVVTGLGPEGSLIVRFAESERAVITGDVTVESEQG